MQHDQAVNKQCCAEGVVFRAVLDASHPAFRPLRLRHEQRIQDVKIWMETDARFVGRRRSLSIATRLRGRKPSRASARWTMCPQYGSEWRRRVGPSTEVTELAAIETPEGRALRQKIAGAIPKPARAVLLAGTAILANCYDFQNAFVDDGTPSRESTVST